MVAPDVCEDDNTASDVVIWLPGAPDAAPRVEHAGESLATTWQPATQGHVVRVAPSPSGGVVTITRDRGGIEQSVQLKLRPRNEDVDPDPALALVKQGEFEAARELVLTRLGDNDPLVVAGAHGLLARLAFYQGRSEETLPQLMAAIRGTPAHLRGPEWISYIAMLAFLRLESGENLGEVRQLMQEAEQLPLTSIRALQQLTWSQGLLALHVGNVRAALGYIEESLELADLLVLDTFAAQSVRDQLAKTYLSVGRYDDAHRMYDELLQRGESADRCRKAWWRANYGYALHRARSRAGVTSRPDVSVGEDALDPREQLNLAIALLGPECRTSSRPGGGVHLLSTIHLSLALDAVSRGQTTEAAAYAEVARALADDLELDSRLELALLRGEVALARGVDASVAFGEVIALSDAAGSAAGRLRGMHGLARAASANGAHEEALSLYEDAERRALKLAHLVPIMSGRDAFLGQREAAARSWVELLLSLDRPTEAFDVVRTLRAQFLASLGAARQLAGLSEEEQLRWDRAVESYEATRRRLEADARESWRVREDRQDEAAAIAATFRQAGYQVLDDAFPVSSGLRLARRPPQAGELMLGWFPLSSEQWIAFARDARGTSVRPLGPVNTADPMLGKKLFAPWSSKIESAGRVTLMPYGVLRSVDLHYLAWDGRTLMERVPVAWALDLTEQVDGPTPAVARALVVSDPRSDLPGARREGVQVAEALATELESVESVSGRKATRAAVLEALREHDVLHFAGHGAFSDGVWDGRLLLAQEGKLSVSDILTLGKVPSRIVLSGCETGRTRGTSLENLGLAQAFITAGSDVVVATSRKVEDEMAAAFSLALHGGGFVAERPVEAFQKAVLAVSAQDANADVAAFRLLVP